MNAKKRLGEWLLYGLCLAPAALMLGYYWLEYIPSQHEYFMNLRFRSLAMMGDHLRIKTERLATSFNYATKFDTQTAQSQYISALVPDLTYPAGGCEASDRRPAEPGKAEPGKIEFGNPENTVRFYPGTGCPAEASLSQIFTGFTRDDLFEDVLIADNPGRVVYQRSASSPRIATLSELLKTAPGAKAAPGEGNGTDADAVRTVRLDDSEFALLVQPVRIAALGARQTLQICGLVRSNRLAQEARHVPPKYLLLLFAPLVIVCLSSPFLKISLLTRTGRLAFHDMVLLGLFTVIAAALATLLLVSWRQYELNERRTERDLANFAGKLNERILLDVERVRGALERFDAALPPTIGQPAEADRIDLPASDLSGKLTEGLDPFDFVFWTNADGCQIAKWTTTLFNFPRVDQSSQQGFQNVVAGDLWSVGPEKPFTVQTVVSQTTSRLIVIMAMPSHASLKVGGCGHPQPSNVVSVALVARLRSLSTPLVPPGAGFAVFEPDGRVIFHSCSERNLHENLFEEIRSPAALREAVAMRAVLAHADYYRGRKFQFHVQPVQGIAGIPWSIAVFQETEPLQAMVGRVWGETLSLFAALLCLIGVGSLVVVVVLRVRRGLSWRRQVDFFLACLWPGPARKPVFRRLAWELAAMTVLSMAVVVRGSADAYRSTGWLLPFCLLVPAAAMVHTAWRLWKPELSPGNVQSAPESQTAYFVCLSLGLVLLAVVPIQGLWSICEAYEIRASLKPWQQELVKSVEARRSQRRADIESSRALSEQARSHFLHKIDDANSLDEHNYVGQFWQTTVASAVGGQPQGTPSGRPEDLAAASPCQRTEGGDWVKLSCVSSSGPPVEVQSTLPPIGIPTHPLWGVLALALLSIAYAWNCKAFGQLFLLDFRYRPLPVLTSLPAAATLRSHLLVLGLPLARKDWAVCQWLGYTPPRVALYNAHFDEGWIEATTALLQKQLTAESAPVALAAAVGATVQSAPAVSVGNWVHVSNLEAKLSEASDRQVVADLIEKLVMMDVRLIVTSVVDPVSHFDSVLSDERKKIYEHPLPEPELQRLAHLLHNFRKVQAPAPDARRPAWAEGPAGEIVYQECRHQQALLDVGEEVAGSPPPDPQPEALLAMIAERARALYKLYWSSCTRSEKLLLIQLAQTGFVNPLCLDTLQELIRKGLILSGRRPRVMNETFRQFLETVEGPDTVRQWESEAGESSWLIIRNILLVLIAVGLGVVGLTQYQVMQTATAALTGVVTLMAGLSRLLGYFTGRRVAAPAESA